MNYQELVNVVTKEVMYVLQEEVSGSSQILHGTEINVSGKTIIFLLPNVDIQIETFIGLLKEFKKKNQVKAFLPKWGRALHVDLHLKDSGIESTYVDYTNLANSKLINGDMIKLGATIIDAGTAESTGEFVGDVDLESVSAKAQIVSPVPGGVGPVTVAKLLFNVVKVAKGLKHV